jgi:inhibitor of cysteine peptidase
MESVMSEMLIVQEDHGKTLEVSQGDTFSVRLAENPSTGYRWGVDASNEQIVKLQGADFSIAPETSMGGGGARFFTFKTQSPGTVRIQLKLAREWEPEDAAIGRFEVTIRVQPS